jgi:hypothetical protein
MISYMKKTFSYDHFLLQIDSLMPASDWFPFLNVHENDNDEYLLTYTYMKIELIPKNYIVMHGIIEYNNRQ